ncbi:MAG: DnaD domain protein [Anaerolineales bacterium]|nr:DnaD domain protein [Anaerolineales bacterium]
MTIFPGFPPKSRTTPVPAQFFTDLLPAIDDLSELKVTLYAIWRVDQMEGNVRFLRRADFTVEDGFMSGLGKTRQEAEIKLDDALARATTRGTLLVATLTGSTLSGGLAKSKSEIEGRAATETLYFLNTPRGRAALESLQQGKWKPDTLRDATPVPAERPNIFRLYETHIGPLTPLIADTLREAEATYPPEWIPDALQIAVENNVRKWRYVEAILNAWLEKGRNDRETLPDSEKDRYKYIRGEFADFIEH